MAFTLRTFVFTRHNEDNSPASGSLTFQLTAPITDGTTTVDPTPIVVTLNGSGYGSVVLNATDDSTTEPQGVTYIVVEKITGAQIDPYAIAVPSAGSGNIDIDTVAHATVNPAYAYVLETMVGVAGGVAELDGTGKVPTSELPAASGGVTTFDTRAGAVTLTKADVTATGLAAADVGADAAGLSAAETTRATTAEGLLAPKASPTFTGTPAAPTPAALDNSTKLATTAYADAAVGVETTRATTAEALKAPLVSPSFTTPTLGAATATTVNKVTFTAPATGATLTIADAKTLTVDNSLELAGTDGTKMTFPTTSATIARTDAANTFTGHQTFEGVTATGSTGVGAMVFNNSPNFTGTPTTATKAALTNSTALATTAYADAAVAVETTRAAPIASPTFTGTPAAPTPATFDNSTKIATTAFVTAMFQALVGPESYVAGGYYPGGNPFATGNVLTNGNLYTMPMVVTKAHTFAAIGGYIATIASAGGFGRMAIYADDGTGFPSSGYYVDANSNSGEFGSLAYSAKTITAISSNSTTFTFTCANNFFLGQTVVVTGCTPAAYNGTWTVSSASAGLFTVANAANPGAGTVFGTATASALPILTTVGQFGVDLSGLTGGGFTLPIGIFHLGFICQGSPTTAAQLRAHTWQPGAALLSMTGFMGGGYCSWQAANAPTNSGALPVTPTKAGAAVGTYVGLSLKAA